MSAPPAIGRRPSRKRIPPKQLSEKLFPLILKNRKNEGGEAMARKIANAIANDETLDISKQIEFLANEARLSKEIFERIHPTHFPMYLIEISKLFVINADPKKELAPYHILRSRGELTTYAQLPPGATVIFISHEWTRREAPDANKVKLRMLCNTLLKLKRGDIDAVKMRPSHAREYNQSYVMSGKQFMAMFSRPTYVWMDWMCMPTTPLVKTAPKPIRPLLRKDIEKARLSLPSYMKRSTITVKLCPPTFWRDTSSTSEEDSSSSSKRGGEKYTCYRTYRSRGWCRVESLIRLFDVDERRSQPHLLITSSSCDPEYVSPLSCRRLLLDRATFSCCEHHTHFALDSTKLCEKETARDVVESVLDRKIDTLLSSGETFRARLFISMKHYWFHGVARAFRRGRARGSHRLVEKLNKQVEKREVEKELIRSGHMSSPHHRTKARGEAAMKMTRKNRASKKLCILGDLTESPDESPTPMLRENSASSAISTESYVSRSSFMSTRSSFMSTSDEDSGIDTGGTAGGESTERRKSKKRRILSKMMKRLKWDYRKEKLAREELLVFAILSRDMSVVKMILKSPEQDDGDDDAVQRTDSSDSAAIPTKTSLAKRSSTSFMRAVSMFRSSSATFAQENGSEETSRTTAPPKKDTLSRRTSTVVMQAVGLLKRKSSSAHSSPIKTAISKKKSRHFSSSSDTMDAEDGGTTISTKRSFGRRLSSVGTIAMKKSFGRRLSSVMMNAMSANRTNNGAHRAPSSLLRMQLNRGYPFLDIDVGMQPLMMAMAFANSDIVEVLVKAGAPVRATCGNGFDALMHACRRGRMANIQWWLSRFSSWDLNRRNEKNGMTALQCTIMSPCSNSAQIVRYLLDHGANVHMGPPTTVNAKDDRAIDVPIMSESVFYTATRHDDGNPEVVRVLLEHLRSKEGVVKELNRSKTSNAMSGIGRMCFALKVSLNASEKKNVDDSYVCSTPLHCALKRGDIEMTRLLLRSGCSTTVLNGLGMDATNLIKYVGFQDCVLNEIVKTYAIRKGALVSRSLRKWKKAASVSPEKEQSKEIDHDVISDERFSKRSEWSTSSTTYDDGDSDDEEEEFSPETFFHGLFDKDGARDEEWERKATVKVLGTLYPDATSTIVSEVMTDAKRRWTGIRRSLGTAKLTAQSPLRES